jgi:8-oxo-dGTP diphosphatase
MAFPEIDLMPTYLLVRHAKAEKRDTWPQPDHLRPLNAAGRRQAEALAEGLCEVPVDEVRTSPAVRCYQTVEPLAERLERDLIIDQSLAEGTRIHLPREPGVFVLCAHGDNIPEVLERFEIDWHECPKASVWMIKCDEHGTALEVAYSEPP